MIDEIKQHLVQDFSKSLEIEQLNDGFLVTIPLEDVFGSFFIVKVYKNNKGQFRITDLGETISILDSHYIKKPDDMYFKSLKERYGVDLISGSLVSASEENLYESILNLYFASFELQNLIFIKNDDNSKKDEFLELTDKTLFQKFPKYQKYRNIKFQSPETMVFYSFHFFVQGMFIDALSTDTNEDARQILKLETVKAADLKISINKGFYAEYESDDNNKNPKKDPAKPILRIETSKIDNSTVITKYYSDQNSSIRERDFYLRDKHKLVDFTQTNLIVILDDRKNIDWDTDLIKKLSEYSHVYKWRQDQKKLKEKLMNKKREA